MERYNSIKAIYGEDNFLKIWNSKILVVGAGGIGCEILKNLALFGFRNIELIDLDTIDVSNLNRQFLFRPEHVGQSKAKIAAEAVTKYNGHLNIKWHHGNIKDPQFGTSFISSFTIILNALDNVDARRHVNRLALASNVPLIDAGSTGYVGQVVPILKGITACYECIPKATQKVYPICTIRSTPDKPVHCIVWAKECFKLLFGQTSDSMLYEDTDNGNISTYMASVLSLPSFTQLDESLWTNTMIDYMYNVLEGLFNLEIVKRIELETYKTSKITPIPISSETLSKGREKASQILNNTQPGVICPFNQSSWDTMIFSVEDYVTEFIICAIKLFSRSKGFDGRNQLTFEKDDDHIMKFVTAASNLRSHIFSIPLTSYYDAKGIAGNIIPAIATTNAIVAGVQVLQAVKYITSPPLSTLHNPEKNPYTASEGHASSSSTNDPKVLNHNLRRICPLVFCMRLPNRKGHYTLPSHAELPRLTCYVCNTCQVTVQIDVTNTTLEQFVNKVLIKRLGFNEPSINVGTNILYECGEGADEDLLDNLPLFLRDCPAGGVNDGSLLTIEDFTQNLSVQVMIKHVDETIFLNSDDETVAADLFVIGGNLPSINLSSTAVEAMKTNENSDQKGPHDDDVEVVIMDEDIVSVPHHIESNTSQRKRKLDEVNP